MKRNTQLDFGVDEESISWRQRKGDREMEVDGLGKADVEMGQDKMLTKAGDTGMGTIGFNHGFSSIVIAAPVEIVKHTIDGIRTAVMKNR